jgi:hypothetical protein
MFLSKYLLGDRPFYYENIGKYERLSAPTSKTTWLMLISEVCKN